MKFWKIIIIEDEKEKILKLASPKSINKPAIKKILKQIHPEWGKFRMLKDKKPKTWVLFEDKV